MVIFPTIMAVFLFSDAAAAVVAATPVEVAVVERDGSIADVVAVVEC